MIEPSLYSETRGLIRPGADFTWAHTYLDVNGHVIFATPIAPMILTSDTSSELLARPPGCLASPSYPGSFDTGAKVCLPSGKKLCY
ncbi:MAG TPA: hypothetical protein PKA27_00030 [Fimbriimonadaceae bacterium]|nr:hypothetical protein [Fimbriimonadaceae bacterium]